MKLRWLVLLGLFACGSEEVEAPLFPVDFATRYQLVRDCRFSIDHGGVSIEVWASAEGASAYRDGTYPLPAGSVLLKTLHADASCADLTGYVAMQKGSDGQWAWQEANAERTVTPNLEAERCVRCHTGCTNQRDLTCTDP